MCKEELVALNVLLGKGKSNSEIAAILGVSEGTVRYHRRKAQISETFPVFEKPFNSTFRNDGAKTSQ
jgi:hypothetical protein